MSSKPKGKNTSSPKTIFELVKQSVARSAEMPFFPSECTPTACMPGTQDKIAVMAKRLEEGVELWHPHDAQDWD